MATAEMSEQFTVNPGNTSLCTKSTMAKHNLCANKNQALHVLHERQEYCSEVGEGGWDSK